MATSTRSIFLSWEQVLDGGGSGEVAVVASPVPPHEELAVCRVLTGNDRIDVSCSANNGPTVSDTMTGVDTQSQHIVQMRIDRPSGPVVVHVVQDGAAGTPATLATPTPPRPAEGEGLQAIVSYEGQSDGAYRFNSVNISERDPN